MENFENIDLESQDDIGIQVNNCCDDCARLDSRVTVAERDIEWMQTSKADKSYVDMLDRQNMKKSIYDSQNEVAGEGGIPGYVNKVTQPFMRTNLYDADKSVYIAGGIPAYVDNKMAHKADKTYVDEQLTSKADTSYVNSQLDLKASNATVEAQGRAIDDLQNTKADISFVIEAIASAIEKMYPIGSYYLSSSAANPLEALGFGTWRRTANGKVLVGVDESDSDLIYPGLEGGNKVHRHTLENGYAKMTYAGSDGFSYQYDRKNVPEWRARTTIAGGQGTWGLSYHTTAVTLGGNADASSNMQPYLTCYIWERIA